MAVPNFCVLVGSGKDTTDVGVVTPSFDSYTSTSQSTAVVRSLECSTLWGSIAIL